MLQKKQCLANKSKLNDGLHLIYPEKVLLWGSLLHDQYYFKKLVCATKVNANPKAVQ
jgi:hypothetical protein